jgi:predicted deacetylase
MTPLTTKAPRHAFLVVLHDVAPPFAIQIEKIVAAMQPLIGSRLGAAVVPSWHGRTLTAADDGFAGFVQASFDEILLHGYEHRRTGGAGLVSMLTGRSDEFNGLSAAEAATRLRCGQQILQERFGRRAEGFIAPTYQRGVLDAPLLAAEGMRFHV